VSRRVYNKERELVQEIIVAKHEIFEVFKVNCLTSYRNQIQCNSIHNV
jgi:hypothetical protein